MKRTICLLLALLLTLGLCACGNKQGEDAGGDATPAPAHTSRPRPSPAVTPAPGLTKSSYRRVNITPDNWTQYFELREIPLYEVTGDNVIATVFQTYCVVLREEYRPYLKPDGDYRVDFSMTFDLYIDTLDVNTGEGYYRHTDDLFYAVEATKSARFDCYALPPEAYGVDQSYYSDYSNAFFTGYAMLHAESRVWSGFYIELDKVRLESVSGYLELAI